MRILLIEDDSATAQTIELMLKSEGFTINTADLGEEGLGLARSSAYDLILLDLNLPDMSGFDVLHKLRSEGICTPIIIISGSRHVVENTVRGLGAGADDYMSKPFHKDELIVRMRAVVRRSKNVSSQPIVTTGNVSVNLDARTALVHGVPCNLTDKEYRILELLSRRKGETVTLDDMFNVLYPVNYRPASRVLEVFINRLRKKIKDPDTGNQPIETERGKGYVLRDPAPPVS